MERLGKGRDFLNFTNDSFNTNSTFEAGEFVGMQFLGYFGSVNYTLLSSSSLLSLITRLVFRLALSKLLKIYSN